MMYNPIRFVSKEEQIYRLNNIDIYRRPLIEVHIADIHFGIIEPLYQYNILKEQFLDRIRDIDFDIVSINGDLFDHKFMSNSDTVMYACLFINDLVDICRIKGATLIIIHGTSSHDSNQLKLFYHYLQDGTVDIRIVEDIRFEYVKGAKILCIPELYGKDKEFYDRYLLSSTYDAVFMHGTIKGAIYSNSSTSIDKAYTFEIDDFQLCKGPIISGHIHVPNCFNKHFYYTGSPIYDRFGEEQQKGFLIVLHNLDTQNYYVHLEPIFSKKYVTINLNHLIYGDPKQIIDYVDSIRGVDNVEYVRIEFDKNDFTDVELSNLDLLKKYYRQNQFIKIKHQDIKNKQVLKANEEVLEKYKKYDYILDKSLDEYEILCMYINTNMKCEYITVDELKKILAECA